MNDEKKRLRNELIKRRKELSSFVKDKLDISVYNNLVSNEIYKNAKGILVYFSGKTEVDTKRIIENALKSGKDIGIPKCSADSNEMTFCLIYGFDDLENGAYSVSEPRDYCEKINDFESFVCIVPALCFDENGYRIGFGKGFYDRFLSENKIKTIGLCYKDFIYKDIPRDEFDIPVDIVISD